MDALRGRNGAGDDGMAGKNGMRNGGPGTRRRRRRRRSSEQRGGGGRGREIVRDEI